MEYLNNIINNISVEIWISIVILIFTGFTLLWKWQDRNKSKPEIQNIYIKYENCFSVHVYNNSLYNIKIKKVFRCRFCFIKKRLSFGLTKPNNEAHSYTLSKQKYENVSVQANSGKTIYIYLGKNEPTSEQTFIFKTNAGTCKKNSDKV